jgi:hypothetical protein
MRVPNGAAGRILPSWRTGLSQTDAEQRVTDVITQAKTALDNARNVAAHLSLWLTASLLIGAFCDRLAATEAVSCGTGLGATIAVELDFGDTVKGENHGPVYSSVSAGSANSDYYPHRATAPLTRHEPARSS